MSPIATSTMTIFAPVAKQGEKVMVLNYRRKPEQWEAAEVTNVYYTPSYTMSKAGGGTYTIDDRWTYKVWIERERKTGPGKYGKTTGGGYQITVGDGQIRRAK